MGKQGIGVTEKLVDFSSSVTFEDLPKHIVHQTKRLICDTVACVLGGYSTDRGRIIRDHVSKLGGNPDSTIIGSSERNSCANAALANACMGNAIDWDDCFYNVSHPAIPSVCAALALGEAEGSTGKDLITAVAAGFDVGSRIGAATKYMFDVDGDKIKRREIMGFSWQVFNAAVSAGKILKLDGESMMNTIGIAGMRAPIPCQAHWIYDPENLPMSKYYDAGWTTYGGITAALLAKSGYVGPYAILEGESGFWRMMGSEVVDYDFMVDQLGKKWWIEETSFKPWPTCRYNHHALTLFTELIEEHDISGEEIEKVVVKGSLMFSPMFKLFDPKGIVNMQFNLPHSLANAAFRIKPSPRWQYPESINDPKRREFRRKVSIENDPYTIKVIAEDMTIGYPKQPKRVPTRVEIHCRGKVFEKSGEYAKGDPWLPETVFSDEEIKEKYMSNATEISSFSIEWDKKCEEAIDKIYNLERLDNLVELTKLLF